MIVTNGVLQVAIWWITHKQFLKAHYSFYEGRHEDTRVECSVHNANISKFQKGANRRFHIFACGNMRSKFYIFAIFGHSVSVNEQQRFRLSISRTAYRKVVDAGGVILGRAHVLLEGRLDVKYVLDKAQEVHGSFHAQTLMKCAGRNSEPSFRSIICREKQRTCSVNRKALVALPRCPSHVHRQCVGVSKMRSLFSNKERPDANGGVIILVPWCQRWCHNTDALRPTVVS